MNEAQRKFTLFENFTLQTLQTLLCKLYFVNFTLQINFALQKLNFECLYVYGMCVVRVNQCTLICTTHYVPPCADTVIHDRINFRVNPEIRFEIELHINRLRFLPVIFCTLQEEVMSSR